MTLITLLIFILIYLKGQASKSRFKFKCLNMFYSFLKDQIKCNIKTKTLKFHTT
jgi:hypothetical protein